MKWNIKRSNEIKEQIAKNEKLMKKLSDSVSAILKKHEINLKGLSYVFEPRIFTLKLNEAPEIMLKSREAMTIAIMENFYKSESMNDKVMDESKYLSALKCLPECGGMDPLTLRILEKYRIPDIFADDPVPIWVNNSIDLMKRIVGNKALLREFSNSVFGILKENGITLKKNEGCVFTPFVFETPNHAQLVGKAKNMEQIRGFGPQVLIDPTSEPANRIHIRAFPGIIEMHRNWRTVGVIVPPWWWIGLPAPEILRAMDVMREVDRVS